MKMKKNLIFVSLIVILLFTISCNNHSKNKIIEVKHIKDITCKNIPSNIVQIKNRIDTNFSDGYFAYSDGEDNTIGLFYIESDSNIKVPIPMKRQKNKKIYHSEFFVYSLDSIFYFDSDLLEFFLLDNSGKILNKFSVTSEYIPNIFASNYFVFSDNFYYSQFLTEADLSLKSSRKQIFETFSPICEINIDSALSSNIISYFGVYPNSYKKGDNYDDYSPSIYVGLQNQIVSSYAKDHNIYVYKNSELIAQKECRSNYIDEFNSISDDDYTNLSICGTFQGEEPEYTNLIVDPYKKRYYRVTKLRMEIGKTDINIDKWTMIIMDENFDVIGEAVLPYSEYFPDIIIPSEKGVYIKRTPKNDKEFKGDLKLSLIQFAL